MNKQELITTLTEQHRIIQADLLAALKKAQTEINGNAKTISEGIIFDFKKFHNDLTAHLVLENDEFYTDYLKKQEEKGEDTAKTKKFIEEMQKIGIQISAFLEKYNMAEKISADIPKFEKELEIIIDILNVRIETEENGVYKFYLLM